VNGSSPVSRVVPAIGVGYALFVLAVTVLVVLRGRWAAHESAAVKAPELLLARPLVTYVAARPMDSLHEISEEDLAAPEGLSRNLRAVSEEDLAAPEGLSRNLRAGLPRKDLLTGRFTPGPVATGQPIWRKTLLERAPAEAVPEPTPPLASPTVLIFSVPATEPWVSTAMETRVWIARSDTLAAEADLVERTCREGDEICVVHVRVDGSAVETLLSIGQPTPELSLTLPLMEARP
jgi:hypothetical protein